MAVNVTDAVWTHSSAKNSALIVMLYIADAADRDGSNAWPHQETMARHTKLSVSAIKAAIAERVKVGELEVERRNRQRGNRYTVLLPGLESYEKRESQNPAVSEKADSQDLDVQEPESGPRESQNLDLLKGNRPSTHPVTDSSSDEEEREVIDDRTPFEVAGDRLCAELGKFLKNDGETDELVQGKVTSKLWRREARLIFEKDEREVEEAIALLRWSQRDEFWRTNILSVPKFRAKYTQLLRKAETDKRNPLKVHELPAAPADRAVELLEPEQVQAIVDRFASDVSLDIAEIWLSQLWFGFVSRPLVDAPNGATELVLLVGGSSRAVSWTELRYGRVLAECAARAEVHNGAIEFTVAQPPIRKEPPPA